MSGLWLASYVALWLLVFAVAVVLISALRNLGVVYTMVSSLPAFSVSQSRRNFLGSLTDGGELPDAVWSTSTGETRRTSDFRGTKVAFVVVSGKCGACEPFLKSLDEPRSTDWHDLVIVSLSGPQETDELLAEAQVAADAVVLLDRDGEIKRKWGVSSTPFMVVVDEEMRIVEQVVGSLAKPIGEQHNGETGQHHKEVVTAR